MDHIKNFFSRVVKTLGDKEERDNIVRITISESIAFEIEKENIKIFGDTIYVRENPVIKNEINLKKTEIISIINKKLGKKLFVDIR